MALSKKTTAYFCSSCGYESAKWMGQCPGCREWNTFVEQPIVPKAQASSAVRQAAAGERRRPVSVREVNAEESPRFSTGMGEMDRVLGGGIVPGSLVLIGGDPGIGKSTILLQVCEKLASDGKKILYVSGEESLYQIKMRATRMGVNAASLFLLCETRFEEIREAMLTDKPDLVVIDSIQTMYRDDLNSAPGSVGQVRECTNLLMQMAKQSGFTVFLVGHVTKEGMVAGPRVLEHMVDTVLYFEGDRSASYRILRAVKNRFGSTNEVGVFEMTGEGLTEVPNPSAFLLRGRPENASGSVVTCSMEGTRPILLEVQALVSKTAFGMPRRTAVGVDYNRVNLLMAVLEKRCRLSLAQMDAYVNVTGGMRVAEPSIDLALVTALVSSVFGIVTDDVIAFGEVGLSGEVRAVSRAGDRLSEAARLGFTQCLMPASSLRGVSVPEGMQVTGIRHLGELMAWMKTHHAKESV